jgi:hypothetical protein
MDDDRPARQIGDMMRRHPFHRALLRSSRIIFPPPRQHIRMTLRCTSRAALCREVLSLVAYGDNPDCEGRGRFLLVLERLVASAIRKRGGPPLPPELMYPPRPRDLKQALRPGLERFRLALEIAHRIVDADGDLKAAAKARSLRKRQAQTEEPESGEIQYPPHKVRARDFEPRRHLIHLAMPVVARWRQSEDYQRAHPHLAPWSLPLQFVELLENDAWIFALLDAAEHWRRRYPALGGIEVRAAEQ